MRWLPTTTTTLLLPLLHLEGLHSAMYEGRKGLRPTVQNVIADVGGIGYHAATDTRYERVTATPAQGFVCFLEEECGGSYVVTMNIYWHNTRK